MDKDFVFSQQDQAAAGPAQQRDFSTGYVKVEKQYSDLNLPGFHGETTRALTMADLLTKLDNLEEKFNARIRSLSDGIETVVRWEVREAVQKLGVRLSEAGRQRRVTRARMVIFIVAAAAVAAEAARFFKYLAS